MYALYDTFNDRIISRHRTIEAVAKAKKTFLNRVERANGRGAYVPVQIREIDANGMPVKPHDDDVDYFHQCEAFAQ
jgi:hypothetical protein